LGINQQKIRKGIRAALRRKQFMYCIPEGTILELSMGTPLRSTLALSIISPPSDTPTRLPISIPHISGARIGECIHDEQVLDH
jgi:hypothetical protein